MLQEDEMMRMLSPMTFVMLSWCVTLLFLPTSCNGEGCNERGWFGTKCQYKCHCTNDNCDFTTGECMDNSVCVRGWFGPQCQYVDVTSESDATNPLWLYDADDATCNDDSAQQTVRVQLYRPLPFTWLRLHVNDKDNLNLIQIQFKNDSSTDNDNLLECNNKRTATVGNNDLDLHCDLDILVQQVILTGSGVKSLCSLYISGGRNVALRQPTSQTPLGIVHYPATASPSDAVDGNREGNCTQLETEEGQSYWNVTFEHPQAINRMFLAGIIYIRYMITWYDEKDSPVLQRNFTDDSSYYYPEDNNITTIQPVASVSSISIVTYYGLEFLCEVEAFGDTVCPQGKYGRECEHSCDNCPNQECFVATGGCPGGCADGFVGGQCQTRCPVATYGKDCLQTCSANCKDQLCDNTNGFCLECVLGKAGDLCDEDCPPTTYGPNCEMSCSTNCTDQLCHPVSGSCNKCLPKVYGPDCEMSCNINCTDQLCHPVSGKCNTCPPGYYGDSCENPEDSTSSSSFPTSAVVGVVVAVVVTVAIVVVGVFLWKRRGKNIKTPPGHVYQNEAITPYYNDPALQEPEAPYESNAYDTIAENPHTLTQDYENTNYENAGVLAVQADNDGHFERDSSLTNTEGRHSKKPSTTTYYNTLD